MLVKNNILCLNIFLKKYLLVYYTTMKPDSGFES